MWPISFFFVFSPPGQFAIISNAVVWHFWRLPLIIVTKKRQTCEQPWFWNETGTPGHEFALQKIATTGGTKYFWEGKILQARTSPRCTMFFRRKEWNTLKRNGANAKSRPQRRFTWHSCGGNAEFAFANKCSQTWECLSAAMTHALNCFEACCRGFARPCSNKVAGVQYLFFHLVALRAFSHALCSS